MYLFDVIYYPNSWFECILLCSLTNVPICYPLTLEIDTFSFRGVNDPFLFSVAGDEITSLFYIWYG